MGATRPVGERRIAAPALSENLVVAGDRQILDDHDEVERVELADARLDGLEAKGVRFEAVRMSRGSMTRARLPRLEWQDVVAETTDCSGLACEEGSFTRVELRGCRLTGARFEDVRFEHVRFVDCQLAYGAFWACSFASVAFERCTLTEADFHGADLRGVAFDACDLTAANLAEAKLARADVSSSVIRDVKIRAADVPGLVVNAEQAIALAAVLGLVVRR